MSIQQLSRRLNKLETTRSATTALMDYGTPFILAQQKLSLADRNAIDQVQTTPDGKRTEAQRAMWSRFERAFEEAKLETKCPYSILLDDMYL